MSGTKRALNMPSLEVSNNLNADTSVCLLTKPITSIGRSPACDLVLDFPFVSGDHLRIERKGEHFVLVHQATTNGLMYQGGQIDGATPFRKELVHRDIFRIGDEHGTFVTLIFDDGSGQDSLLDVRPIALGSGEVTIGREHDNTVVLSHPQVSAHHARLVHEQSGYRMIDLGSTNHVYVNSQPVAHQLLTINDEIRIGPFRFVYTGNQLKQYDESADVSIEVVKLKKFGNNNAILLHDISFTIPARKFVAFVGGSGAGKSTLMNAVSGFRPADAGVVRYNGQNYSSSFKSQIGYVPQDDIVHQELTVERALYYAAKMRLPEDFTHQQILQRIEEVLKDVELIGRRGLRISKLSGGQRKRVSIALELLAKPAVFFLDEPTSGLDPGLDRKLMQLLRRLSDKGHTVVLVTHAISNINYCDSVCFLAPGGYLAYFGPPQGVYAYFGQPDFAEVYNMLEPTALNPHIPAEAALRFQNYQGSMRNVFQSAQQQQMQAMKAPKPGNPWKQFWLLSMRYIELLKNDTVNLIILLLQAPIIGLLLLFFILAIGRGGFDTTTVIQCPTTQHVLTPAGRPDLPTPYNPPVSKSCTVLEHFLRTDVRGKAYAAVRGGEKQALQDFILPGPGNAPTILFIMAFSAVMFGCINAAREIVKEAAIYKRERAVNLGLLPYLFSKIVVLSILCLLQSLILVGLVSVFDPFPQSVFVHPPFLEVYITVALTSFAGLMMGLTVSAFAPNNDRAMSLTPILLLPQVIFSGTIFPLTHWPLQILGVFFAARWSMAALGSSVGLHSDKLNGDALFGDNYTYHSTLFSTESQADATHYLILLWLALGIMIVVFAIATAAFLKLKDQQK
jgi:ABC-type multidrug transport system ATPase subunit/pSer/pThr/pTyr-binding forkhead associated (FHA) protein/ABC-type multidrug transport system permease subunit